MFDDTMVTDAEQFLVKVTKKKFDSCMSFNEFIELPCSSAAIHENIKRGYMQTKCWLDAPFLNATDSRDPCDYGYSAHPETNTIEPCLFSGPQKPQDVPDSQNHALARHVREEHALVAWQLFHVVTLWVYRRWL